MSHYDIACKWLNENENTWRHWKQIRRNEEYRILGLFPFTGSAYNGQGVADAAQMAVDYINQNSSILRDITLVLYKHDGQCSTDTVMSRFIESVLHNEYQKLIGILGKQSCSHHDSFYTFTIDCETFEPWAYIGRTCHVSIS